jgi:adenylate cyclase
MSEGTKRRLAAILAADVVGYSRLMGEDEAGTLSALRRLRSELFAPTVDVNSGAVVKSMGDGWLVAFDSAADAVTCAIAVQESLADHDTIKLRAGIHVGDVTHADEDVFGDGVNIAARLQDLADPGSIVISDTARRSIDGKLAADFNDLGEQNLKNIAEPVNVYGWGMRKIDGPTAGPALPDKPSIAVLPFENMSGDPAQEYFSDGMTEDIITALSKFRSFLVSGRNSTFAYKGLNKSTSEVGRTLGVRYVLEGSIRTAGNRVRVNAQLVEAESDNHTWAERFEGSLDDVFALQDKMTAAVAGAVGAELEEAERQRVKQRPPASPKAWDLYQQGMWCFYQFDRDTYGKARTLFEEAIALDPDFAAAHAALAYWISHNQVSNYVAAGENDSTIAVDVSRRAVEIDDRDAYAHFVRGRIHYDGDDLEGALSEIKRALELNPNLATAYFFLSWLHVWMCKGVEAVEAADHAIRLSPNDPVMWAMENWKSNGYLLQGKFDDALIWAERASHRPNSGFWPHIVRANLLIAMDRNDEARDAVVRALEKFPDLTVSFVRNFFRAWRWESKERYLSNLAEAGLPG